MGAAILNLESLGLLPETILLGPAIYDRPCDATRERGDAYEVFRAALLVPGGLGVVAWDSDEDAAQARSPSRDPGRALERFVAYPALAPGLKALLLPHVDDLLDRLLQHVDLKRLGTGEREGHEVGPAVDGGADAGPGPSNEY